MLRKVWRGEYSSGLLLAVFVVWGGPGYLAIISMPYWATYLPGGLMWHWLSIIFLREILWLLWLPCLIWLGIGCYRAAARLSSRPQLWLRRFLSLLLIVGLLTIYSSGGEIVMDVSRFVMGR